MIYWHDPTSEEIAATMDRVSRTSFSYAATGCTRRDEAPAGFYVDHYRTVIGHGIGDFEKASSIVQSARFFPPTMTRLVRESCEPIAPRELLATVYRFIAWPMWLLMPARVVYTFDEQIGPMHRSGWALGTLAGHPKCGEERFEAALDERTDEVAFLIHAVSRPATWYAWTGLPLARYEQARFRCLASQEVSQRVAATSHCEV